MSGTAVLSNFAKGCHLADQYPPCRRYAYNGLAGGAMDWSLARVCPLGERTSAAHVSTSRYSRKLQCLSMTSCMRERFVGYRVIPEEFCDIASSVDR